MDERTRAQGDVVQALTEHHYALGVEMDGDVLVCTPQRARHWLRPDMPGADADGADMEPDPLYPPLRFDTMGKRVEDPDDRLKHLRAVNFELARADILRRHAERPRAGTTRPDFDPATAQDATTAEEALALSTAWAKGTRSWWNQILDFEARDQLGVTDGARQQSFVACAQADSAEVAKWAALVPAFIAMGRP